MQKSWNDERTERQKLAHTTGEPPAEVFINNSNCRLYWKSQRHSRSIMARRHYHELLRRDSWY